MLKILIAEDDLASRKLLKKFLSQYGTCDIVVDGLEAIDAYMLAMREKQPYDLICLDIMMPKIDGVKVLKAIRDMETQNFILPEKRVKIIMTTALAEAELVQTAFEYGCEAYASKPINMNKFEEVMEKLELIPKKESEY
ncbi:MAG: two-component system, chemotaxis family, chemotaxis protein CheY [Epulopiscium sp.]|jgi:two-component system chemotaxis response regulator CheY|nr:response regulator receiver protein [Defluviitaleaceae bacterium]MDK2787653.1 two-component system, chemotaxis family, chemotaxis protein CheY [Candidatus Epulonipiscium sp.]